MVVAIIIQPRTYNARIFLRIHLFSHQQETFPGAVFHLASGLLLIAMVLNLFIYKTLRLQLRDEKDGDVENKIKKVAESTKVACQ
jgi:hypothetical protein